MTGKVLQKFLWHTGTGLLIWLIVGKISAMGKIYAGWIAGLLGACYLLFGYLSWLKHKGTDLGRVIRRKKAPEVPFYLRGSEKNIRPHFGFSGSRRVFDDEETEDEKLLPDQIYQVRAFAWGLTGLCLFILSAF